MPRLYSVLVTWRGETVLERYFNGRDARDIANVKSVSKSVMSALVGAAIEGGFIAGVDEPIATWFPSIANEAGKAEITIEDLLTMRSGLETTSNRNYGRWVQSNDWVEFALEQPVVAEPGRAMIYSTGNTHLLSAIVTRATGQSTLDFARSALAPLGFEVAPWPTDPAGIYFGGNDMEMTPRQMAAFGALYLNSGRAGGQQVLSRDWVATSLQPRVASPRGEGRRYAYGWWVRDMAGFEVPYAWGFGGQFIVLVPDLEMVIVTTSSSFPGPERRSHTRSIYNFVEHELIAPAARRLNTQGGSGR